MAVDKLVKMPKYKMLAQNLGTTGVVEINEKISDFSFIIIAVSWSYAYTGFGIIPVAYWNSNNNNPFPVRLNNNTDTQGVSLTYRNSNSSKIWFTVSRTADSVYYSVVGIY